MVKVFTFSEPGGHAENEDAFAVCPHPRDQDCWLCVVADGQGGRQGGGPAARLACKLTIESAAAFPLQALLVPDSWYNVLRAVDASGMGFTTLVAQCILGAIVCGASSGDSATVVVQA